MRDVVVDIAAKRAALAPDRVAMEDLSTGATVTYAQFNDRAARVARLLTEEGVTPGERVGVLCRNRVEFFEVLFACAKLGAIMVPLSWRAPTAELNGLGADSTPTLIFHGKEDTESAVALNVSRRIGFDEDYAARVNDAQPLDHRAFWPSDDCWYLIYTSGTTGAPKGVIQTYRMAMANYVNIRQAIDLRGDDVTLNFLPLYHTAGINLHTLPVFIAGGKSLVASAFDANTMFDALANRKLDVIFAVPAVYQQLALHPRFASADLARAQLGLWRGAVAGCPRGNLSEEERARAERHGHDRDRPDCVSGDAGTRMGQDRDGWAPTDSDRRAHRRRRWR